MAQLSQKEMYELLSYLEKQLDNVFSGVAGGLVTAYLLNNATLSTAIINLSLAFLAIVIVEKTAVYLGKKMCA